jgi:hypothetical protein
MNDSTGRGKQARRILYAVVGLFTAGYFPTAFIPPPWGVQIGLALSAVVVIPFGATTDNVFRGLLRGFALGLPAGAGVAFGLMTLMIRKMMDPQAIDRLALVWGGATLVLCTLVAGFYAWLGRYRRRRADAQWERYE